MIAPKFIKFRRRVISFYSALMYSNQPGQNMRPQCILLNLVPRIGCFIAWENVCEMREKRVRKILK